MRSSGKQALCGNLTIGVPVLADKYEVHYQVQNESQLRELETSKHELVQYLQKNLRNYSIRLLLTKAEAPIKTRPFTPDEKLKAMEEKNPHITLLRKTLGLNPG
jgi:DNA polymerase-3 subunit gamma/tau